MACAKQCGVATVAAKGASFPWRDAAIGCESKAKVAASIKKPPPWNAARHRVVHYLRNHPGGAVQVSVKFAMFDTMLLLVTSVVPILVMCTRSQPEKLAGLRVQVVVTVCEPGAEK